MGGEAFECSEHLEEVNFSWCRGISSAGLGFLVDSCANLQKITLFGCTQVVALACAVGSGPLLPIHSSILTPERPPMTHASCLFCAILTRMIDSDDS